ncbi:MAG: leucyl aminopeptidase [Actinobacteria bacterium]|nr:leucyl aminopeptidase [Actinomycetota bacterium]
MAKVTLTDAAITQEVLVVGLAHKKNDAKKLVIESGDITLDSKTLLSALEDLGATGSADEIIKLPGTTTRLIVFTGLGCEEKKYPHEVLRRATGAATRSLAGNTTVAFSLPTRTIDSVAAIAEGAALGSYSFDEFRSSSKAAQKLPVANIVIHTSLARKTEAKESVKRAMIIGQYTTLVRDLINMPPSHLTPISFCALISQAVTLAGGSKAGLKVSILTDAQLRAQGFGGITAVGQGSANPPRLLHISYTPTKYKKKLAYVGKGITFDSGGLALKPALGMEAMKSDMSGAAAVCAAVMSIATLKLPIAIDAWAPLAENMISDTATRPSDIITIYGGKTVEVLNPDAEGRLVLADALSKAIEIGRKGKSTLDGIVDVATLTGAQVVALGTRTSAVMTNNEKFRNQFLAAAQDSGESFWPMPLPIELRASLDSPVADLANIGDRMGGMLVAGLFLKDFIPDDLPWLHLDIAGPAYNEGSAHGYTPVGGTGIAMRSLVTLAQSYLN